MAKKVLLFGTFDGIHAGHRYFIKEAKSLGDSLTVVVARDKTANEIKKHYPKLDENVRLEEIKKLEGVDSALLGDEELGNYEILEAANPDIIAIGHDQDELKADLGQWITENKKAIELVQIAKYDRTND